MSENLKPTVIKFNLPELLKVKNGDKLAVNLFPELIIEDTSEHQEYDSKYAEIANRANFYVETALYSAMCKLRESGKALYSYAPYYEIQEDGVMICEVYYYASDDLESDLHDHGNNRAEIEELAGEGIFIHSLNVTKYFESCIH